MHLKDDSLRQQSLLTSLEAKCPEEEEISHGKRDFLWGRGWVF
jgi:hypothetical protein